jgi:anti-sigma regulatory factor (Ser/Thr protein kinase)
MNLSGSGPAAPGAVRGWARHVLTGLGDDHLTDVLIVAVELVTNALEHGGGPRSVRLKRDYGTCVVHIAVEDSNTAQLTPGVSRFGVAAHRGRGLLMVNAASRLWGVRLDEVRGRKTVWTELGCPGGTCAQGTLAVDLSHPSARARALDRER